MRFILEESTPYRESLYLEGMTVRINMSLKDESTKSSIRMPNFTAEKALDHAQIRTYETSYGAARVYEARGAVIPQQFTICIPYCIPFINQEPCIDLISGTISFQPCVGGPINWPSPFRNMFRSRRAFMTSRTSLPPFQTSSPIIRDVSSFSLGHTLTAISRNHS